MSLGVERPTLETSGAERKRNIEVIHLENFDVVLNTPSPDSDEVRQRISEFLSIIEEVSLERGEEYINFPKENPKFFIKEHRVFKRLLMSGDKSVLQGTGIEPKTNRAFTSLLNEVSLAPVVMSVVDSEESQALARKYGFESIEFIEPVAGFLDKHSGRRFVVYPYTVDAGAEDRNKPAYIQKFNVLAQALETIFFKKGIQAYDLDWRQFIVSDRKLYLIDVEAYTKKKNSPEAKSA